MTIEELNSKVVVGIRHRYNDNDGAYHVAYFLSDDKKKLYTKMYSDGYNGIPHDAVSVNASEADIEIARKIYVDKNMSMDDNDSIIGCTVILSHSRKAPNNVELLVTNWHETQYNRFGQKVPNTIDVQESDKHIHTGIAETTIKKYIRGAFPNFF